MNTTTRKKQSHASNPTTVEPPPCTDRFVCLFRYSWGRGATAEEAIKVARRNGGKGKDYGVYCVPEGGTNVVVDPMGRVWWDGPAGDLETVKLSGAFAKEV